MSQYLCKIIDFVHQSLRAITITVNKERKKKKFPDGVMEFFIDINPSDRTMALGSTQPLTEMSTWRMSWG
jgi:membrane-bound lytic murein transglycosylase B